MRIALVAGLAALLLVPSAAPVGIPGGEVVYAEWLVGMRFTREEWLDQETGATHRIDTGGPVCRRHTIANRRWVAYYSEDGRYVCGRRQTYRLHGARDRRLLEASDLLRPRRLLRLGRATVVGDTSVDGIAAVRVRVPWPYGEEYVDLDRGTRLPLRFERFQNGVKSDEWKLSYRSVRRVSLPPGFFSPRGTRPRPRSGA